MDDLAAPASVFLLQHPLANPKDPPVAIPTLTARQRQNPPTQVPPTPTSLTASLSPPGSPPLAARPPRQSPHHSHSHQSSTAVSITSAVSISSKALQSQPAQLSLARDLTTRLWQREAELQRMKDLYDAKIRCLTEMLQDAGVSPTEVANNLAVVTEKRVVRKPLFDQLASPTSEHLAETGRGRLPEGFFDEDSNSIAGREADLGIDNEDNGTPPHSGHTNGIDHRRDDDDNNNNNNNNDNNTSNGEDEEGSSECVSCSDSTSVLSSCPTHRSKRPLEVKASSTQTLAVARAAMATPTTSTWTSLSSGEGVGACGPPPCSPTTSDSSSSLSSSFTASSHSHQRRTVHTVHSVQANTDGTSPVADTKLEVNAQTETTAASQSPIPSFIAESLAAGTMGIKSLREKWAIASGVLSWNKPRPDSHGNSTSTSANASMVTSPSGLFVRQEGIMNDKKPALVEACIPPPLQDDLTSLCSDREKDPWAAIVPVPSRKYAKGHGLHVRPMSDVGYLSGTSGLSSKYPAFTMAKDIPRPPISRIHEYLRQPDSFTPSSNPSPLHYRAISMAANLIDTGAITPAKLYARRTQTMIAKWTLGLIMNSKQRNSPNSFPVVRESHPEEEGEGEEEDLEERKRRPHGRDLDSTEDNGASSRNGVADLASSYEARRPDMLSPTDIPRALSSFRNHPTSTPLSSSYQPPSSLLYQSHFSPSTRSVVELSDISPAPLSMSPTFSYLGEAQRPLTDRYGFLVNARPMAVQQGLLKLNDVYGLESDFSDRGSSVHQPHHQDRHHDRSPSRDLTDSMSANEKNCEFLQTPTEEIEKRSLGPSSPPSIPPLSYFSASRMSASSASSVISSSALGPAAVVTLGTGSVGASGTGAIGTSTTPATSTPSSIPTSTTTPILSTATRPMSTLSPPNSNSATVTSLLSQIKVLHDSVQLTQKEKWDAFLRKRRRRIHMGEANGGLSGNLSSTNLSSPLFGSLIMSPPDQEDQDDEDMVYWSSVCMIGIATMGKGSDWEEFRDLVRGGIPVAYR
ncbi:hypothetical protein BGW38_004329 [Lunasporangiospora selenospora]|uniref:Uncharacterized protein n=1 Tax=Lunasporangiospora selenospora TaxID=979761 RepID=A0A9P6FRF8_9FUNG|nr:hypothetical protein BGW38_004329 [Lunasporangiospora selenospora]